MFSDNGGDRDNTRTWTIILATAAIAFAPLYTLKELAMQTQGTAAQSAGTALDMWQKLAFTLVLVSAYPHSCCHTDSAADSARASQACAGTAV